MNLHLFLVFAHIVGVVLGTGGATFAEIFYLKAKRDGVFEPLEVDYLKTSYFVLRVGLFIIVLSGFGLLVLLRLNEFGDPLLGVKLWAKLLIVLIIVLNAFLIQARKMPMWLGSSLSLTSWYTATILGLWRGIPYSFGQIIIFYLLSVMVVAYVLHIIDKRILKSVTIKK
ncbi:MAG: hypothetical protein COU71_02965 [Parcubacteria group bacterium CG10_big_fil_rev_8_21_14_0_10_38_31]|nr:MAG: hypothetical protein COU71_02965 [Parcubacteria group bacterium CG10_big_fil_rev_8_21_14_0_10_38_31]